MFVSVKVKVYVDNAGDGIDIPGLMTPDGLLTPLLNYFLNRRSQRSLPWMRKVTRSVELFLEYMLGNPHERDTRALFDNFATRLHSGTFDRKTHLDPSGLFWVPRSSSDAANILTDLTLFFDWLGENNPVAANINPRVEANAYDRRWNEAARRYRRDRALLGHLWSTKDDDTGKTRRVRGRRAPTTRSAEPPAFPEDRFDELIQVGFRVGDRVDYRGICITLLLHGAGFRESEPFHMYVDDVIADPKTPSTALVRIHHPSEGSAPPFWKDALGRPKTGPRRSYLMERFGLLPRNEVLDTTYAGWKGAFLDAPYYMEARWFEPRYGETFMENWLRYLHQVTMVKRSHPFALINLGREPRGGMYKLSEFNSAHAAACRRIGLVVRKELGTTPHGHRHAYGRRLKKAKVDEKTIQLCMHHASGESQKVYTQPTSTEILDALNAANSRLASQERPPLLTATK